MTITVYHCPTLGPCSWEGTRHEIVPHFRGVHPNLLLTSQSFQLRPDIREVNYLMYLGASDEMYLIQVRFIDHKLLVQVRFAGVESRARTKSYKIRLEAPPGTVFRHHLIEASSATVNFNVDIPAMKDKVISCCITFVNMAIVQPIVEASSKFVSNPLSSLRRKSSSKWSRAKLPLSRSQSVRSSRFYVNDVQFDEETESHSLLKLADERISLLKDYRCAKCTFYIAGPIFRCSGDHSICFPCLPRDRKCPAAECSFDGVDQRDRMLEHTRDLTTLPCRFNGCGELVLGSRLQEHQMQCNHCVYTCPECKRLIGKYGEVEKHFRIVHPSIKRVTSLETPFANHNSFVVIHHMGVFHCTWGVEQDTVEWVVEQCGHIKIYFDAEVIIKSNKTHENKIIILEHSDTVNKVTRCISIRDTKVSRLRNAVLRINLYN